MNRLARMMAWLLAVCLMVALVPAAAFAAGDTGKAIQLGASGISGYDSTNGYDYIYMGYWTAPDSRTTSGPIKWRVLDDQTNTGASGLFLLSDVLLGTGQYGDVFFDSSAPHSNEWQGSETQAWCEDFAGISGSSVTDAFTPAELDAVLATTKSDGAFTSSTHFAPFSASTNILNGDRVFFLSAQEAENANYGFVNDAARVANYGVLAGGWWLRSPFTYTSQASGFVNSGGIVGPSIVNDYWPARPAFNVNLNSVLFASAAEGGKISGGEADGKISKIPTIETNEWKLTVLDKNRNFAVDQTPVTAMAGNTIDLDYTGAATGENEYISMILADADGAQYYGRVLKPTNASGTVSVSLPADLSAGSYTLHVFSEQCNEDKRTDYASAFCDVSLNILSPPVSLPETGDSAMPMLWMAMGAVSVLGLLLLRKKAYSR